MNMTCKTVRNLADLYHEKIVSKESADAIRAHLKECSECRNYYRAYMDLKTTKAELDIANLSGTQARMYEELSKKLRRRRYLRIVGTSAAIGAGSIMLAVGILLTCKFNAESLMKR